MNIPESLVESVNAAYITPGDVLVDDLIPGRVGLVYTMKRDAYSYRIVIVTIGPDDADDDDELIAHGTQLLGRLRGAHVSRVDGEWRMSYMPDQLRIANVPGEELSVALARTMRMAGVA